MKRAKIGRPRRTTVVSTRVVGVRMTNSERAAMKRAARREPLAAWIRRVALAAAKKRNGR